MRTAWRIAGSIEAAAIPELAVAGGVGGTAMTAADEVGLVDTGVPLVAIAVWIFTNDQYNLVKMPTARTVAAPGDTDWCSAKSSFLCVESIVSARMRMAYDPT